jgi:hypothetical protein
MSLPRSSCGFLQVPGVFLECVVIVSVTAAFLASCQHGAVLTEEAKQVAKKVVRPSTFASNRESWIERKGVSYSHCPHDGQYRSQVNSHAVHF